MNAENLPYFVVVVSVDPVAIVEEPVVVFVVIVVKVVAWGVVEAWKRG